MKAFITTLLVVFPVLAMAAAPGGETICHIPPGSAESAHTLVVSAAALPAHLAHGDLVGPCAPACQSNGGACTSDGQCCSGWCGAGTCATPCAANGGGCQGDGDCCSGHCAGGTCTTPCAANGNACTEGGDCCSGLCNSNVCVPPCTVNDGACGAGSECCSGICEGGVCQPPCAGSGDSCGTGADCCSGICTDTTKTCASECTIGPEWGAPECSTSLDCCEGEGVCIYGACYRDDGSGTITCRDLGEACNDFAGLPCCFFASCACTEPDCSTGGVCISQP